MSGSGSAAEATLGVPSDSDEPVALSGQPSRQHAASALGPPWGREPAVTHGQQRSPADSRNHSSTAILAVMGAAGPYMACKGSAFNSP
jgi:hypothetical protein